MRKRLDREYFEDLYARSGDPWSFETSEYERKKYERTLGVLGDHRFRRAMEVGASIGVFTEMLAPLCDELVAVDTSEKAVEAARRRLAGHPHVRVERRTLPEEMPEGEFGLILASEVLYYLTRDVMLESLRRFESALTPGGMLLAVHWRRETKTYPLQGDEVHALLLEYSSLERVETVIEPEYRLDLLQDSREER